MKEYDYLLAEGPEGMLSVFWRLNLPVLSPSVDCEKLMLLCLKNSKPPVELGSYDETKVNTLTQKHSRYFLFPYTTWEQTENYLVEH